MSILANDRIAAAIPNKATPNIVKPIAVLIIPGMEFSIFVITTSVKRPLTIDIASTSSNFLMADDNTDRDVANSSNPKPLIPPIPSNLAKFKNRVNAPKTVDIAINPLTSTSVSRLPSFSTTLAIPFRALVNNIIPTAAFVILDAFLDILFADTINAVHITAIATLPLAICPQSNPTILIIVLANDDNASDNAVMVTIVLTTDEPFID